MLVLYQPLMKDLWFKEQMMGDEHTMSFNHAWGGTIPFPEERWADWYDRWITNHHHKRFYRYLTEDGAFVGEAAYRFDEELQLYMADVIVYAPYRGMGYGRRGLLLLCEAAKANGVQVLCDDIAIDNPSVSLFLSCGFVEVRRTSQSVLVKKEL